MSFFFNNFFKVYLFLEKGEGKEKERERNINEWLPLRHPELGTRPATQACALTGNRTDDDLLIRRPVLNALAGVVCFVLITVLLICIDFVNP